MRILALALAALATACADQRYFAPRENQNGTGPGGYPAAVYPFESDGVAGELRLWSRGSFRAAEPATGEEVVELQVGFELENHGTKPIELAGVKCVELWIGEFRRSELLPTRVDGFMIVAPDSTARVQTWFRLDGVNSARDLDGFTLRFEVKADGVPVLTQVTPFAVYIPRDRSDYDPWFYGRPYGYGYWGLGLGFGWHRR